MMNKIRNRLFAVGFSALCAFVTVAKAADNSTVPVAVGNEIFANKDIGGVKFPKHILYNSSGIEVGTAAAPLFMQSASGAFASGSFASGAFASGAFASGAFASGSFASGAFASGSHASGSFASGAMVDIGAAGSTVCATDTGSCNINALFQRLLQGITTLNTTAGTAGTFQAAATGGASTAGVVAPNNNTAVVVKASAGTLYGVQIYGINAAPAYLKFYNATSATCGSGTPVKRLMIPAAVTAANGAGSNVSFGDVGVAFATGITYCVVTGITDADSTAVTASNFLINVDFK